MVAAIFGGIIADVFLRLPGLHAEYHRLYEVSRTNRRTPCMSVAICLAGQPLEFLHHSEKGRNDTWRRRTLPLIQFSQGIVPSIAKVHVRIIWSAAPCCCYIGLVARPSKCRRLYEVFKQEGGPQTFLPPSACPGSHRNSRTMLRKGGRTRVVEGHFRCSNYHGKSFAPLQMST